MTGLARALLTIAVEPWWQPPPECLRAAARVPQDGRGALDRQYEACPAPTRPALAGKPCSTHAITRGAVHLTTPRADRERTLPAGPLHQGEVTCID